MKTSLYRYFDVDDVLLYVGIAYNPFIRSKQHEAKHDMTTVRLVEIEWFDSREDAKIAEQWAIIRERPAWNVVGVRRPRKLRETPQEAFELAQQAELPEVVETPDPKTQMTEKAEEKRRSWNNFIGPPAPYYWFHFSDEREEYSEDGYKWVPVPNDFDTLNDMLYLRIGDVVLCGAEMPDAFWNSVFSNRIYIHPKTLGFEEIMVRYLEARRDVEVFAEFAQEHADLLVMNTGEQG